MSDRPSVSAAELFRLILRYASRALGGGLTIVTLVGLIRVWRGGSDTLLIVCSTTWVVVGIISVIMQVVEVVPNALARLLMDVGLSRAQGFSDIETMVARGAYAAAAESYRERTRNPWTRTEATLRRAALLAGPLGVPKAAVAELEALREHHPQGPADDIWIGRTLADLYEHALDDPGKAMAELRRLLDRHPSTAQGPVLRRALDDLRAQRFPEAVPVHRDPTTEESP